MSDIEKELKIIPFTARSFREMDSVVDFEVYKEKVSLALDEIKKLQAENAELKSKLGLCANNLLLALNLDEIEDEEDKASIHAKANDFIVECDIKLKGL